MIPYGKNRKFRYNYRDHHLKKEKTINWWEDELDIVNKKSERQKAKKEIKKTIK
jgi:hypothetical protein